MTLISGNEAIALGAAEAGCSFATAYPGTPSTEILEAVIRRHREIKSQWAVNEKVALEVGYGACLAGARTMVCMKQVGLNVAADPFFTISYTGVNGGLVIVSADEPGVHSSQNEQDNRNYAAFAKIPMLEPADSQEAKEMTIFAFELSEKFDTPVLLRVTTRVCHTCSRVFPSQPKTVLLRDYVRDFRKRTMVPVNALHRHAAVEERLAAMSSFSNETPWNEITWKSRDIGMITSGVSHFHAVEAFPQYSVLKLGLSYPLPQNKIREFAEGVKQIYIVEENDPFIENQVRGMNLPCEIHGKDMLPVVGELSPEKISCGFKGKRSLKSGLSDDAIKRLPVFCPGCPHRGSFYLLKKHADVITGDIGCYGLAALPPLQCMDSIICMGASVGMAEGFKAVRPESRVIGVLGDSTFFHSGLTGLLDIVSNRSGAKIAVLDNATTAMTGHQPHPGSPCDSHGKERKPVDPARLIEAAGICMEVLDPLNLKESAAGLERIMSLPEPAVAVFRSACALLPEVRAMKRPSLRIFQDECVNCGLCLTLLCPAMEKGDKPVIRDFLCSGCGLCAQVCPKKAIRGGDL
ncbi:MAG: thiamine pyrophosphate-dependent enzyme [Candidatus Wallbacteria bacterium]|nr:thiamine pyrophosphate-dependent enzyme [Candidatus Wallbacteria bacterium]